MAGFALGPIFRLTHRTVADAKNICTIPHAQAGCVAGLCVVATCGSGYVDLDRKPRKRLRMPAKQRWRPRFCDGVDNNCNGLVDEGFNLQSDAANCGPVRQGVQLCPRHGTLANRGSAGSLACPAMLISTGRPENGCEQACTPSKQTASKSADGKDNDCNGLVDDAARTWVKPVAGKRVPAWCC